MPPIQGQPAAGTDELEELEVVDAEVVEDDPVAAAGPRRARLLEAGAEVPAPSAVPAQAPVPRAIARVRAMVPAAARAAGVAAGGFAVGAVSMAVARHAASRRIVARRGPRVHGIPVAGTRTFLVDVHVVDRDRLRR